MSVIGEVVGIVACVAAVVSAYHDGGAIVQKLKVKRAARRAPAPPRLLEESIDQAPAEIEREKQRGIQRFGKAFEDGDSVAIIALQSITIQLQQSLLEKLRNDDDQVDFIYLCDAADSGRDRTIASLLELRQRLLAAKPINEVRGSISQARGSVGRITEVPTIHSANSPEPGQESEKSRSRRTWSREIHNAPPEDEAAAGAESNSGQRSERKRSLFGLFKHHRSRSGSHNGRQIEEERQHASSPPKALPKSPHPASASSPPPTSPSAPQQTFHYQEWEDDPAKIWADTPQRRDTVTSLAVPPDGDPVSPNPSLRSQSIAATNMPVRVQSFSNNNVPTPTRENDYLGFCKSACALQNGDRKAMQKCKEFNDGWSQSQVYYLCCASSKCAFAGHINIDKIWDKVWPVESKGLKFRWPFLAKSHVAQQKVKDHQYAYQCLFCVFGGEKSPVYFGTDTYLEHVSGAHRGKLLSEVVLYKTKAVAGREAENGEDFDINLLPLTAKEQVQRKQSEVLADELLKFNEERRQQEEADGVAHSNEPWNEGLSDFKHWGGGEMERVELE